MTGGVEGGARLASEGGGAVAEGAVSTGGGGLGERGSGRHEALERRIGVPSSITIRILTPMPSFAPCAVLRDPPPSHIGAALWADIKAGVRAAFQWRSYSPAGCKSLKEFGRRL